MSSQPAFVIAPGSFAKPALYTQLEAEIRLQGHEVQIVTLPSVDSGTGNPPATMEHDTACIRTVILDYLDRDIEPKDIVLITHSYSGVPGNCALEGLLRVDRLQKGRKTAVVGYISMASYLPLVGESIRSICATYDVQLPEPLKSGIPGSYMPVNQEVVASVVFNDIPDPAIVQEYAVNFAAHSSDSYNGKVTYEAWKVIPTMTVIPDNDLLMPLSLHNGMCERAIKSAKVNKVVVAGAGHGLNISRTREVLAEILRFTKEI